MTIFRCELLGAMAVLVPAFAAAAAPAVEAEATPAETCRRIDPSAERACIGERVERKVRTMRAIYPRAVARLRENYSRSGDRDNRTAPRFLVRAQKEWERFVDDNCTVTGSFGGGSNSSISDRIQDCYEQELDRRIAYLGDLAEGVGEFGP